ncbi:MAG: imidazole glycerol phosphate synthase subunit HisH [Ignavibacteriaceae bacterium]|nr:imidazole glycerol phosphate synthase subunit HisH [Ignavibacterium sp.]MCC6254036.1 imidazole glycerol phosphate synthase subunit HisH [Ignavibacteriaceae bacterium]HRN27891.1 imidazole glycerol phosphate synthase subunit HisH [Ignavibacteriaceae bacterium]HRP92235.1 imidazole glycerol phosphate synthase subunit HisH [Ignavibacteriaceae bacterium]HRQ55165.1 imidazole glycerol phosphate synthase subunit HisH [Ignavibacteriaceae bacterium]
MVTIIDYGDTCTSKVVESIKNITDDFIVSRNEVEICRSDKIIFAGCGSAAEAMKKIHLLNLFSVLRIVKKPMLGIGLGMQLMADYSTEGNISCLGFFSGTAIKYDDSINESAYKGMHKISFYKHSILFDGIDVNSEFYFNNSYYLPKNEDSTSLSKNNVDVCTSIENENAYGVQFHPEMSGEAGLKLLKNFIEM